jgi:hypothetical protein
LANLLNLTEVRIQQLVKLGVVVRGERGRYDLWASIKGYVKFLQERTAGRSAGETGDEYDKQRTRLYKARAELAENQSLIMQGKVHDAEAVAAVWSDMVTSSRSKLLSMPTKLAGSVQGMSDIAEIRAALEAGVHEALNELAQYDPGRVTGRFVQVNSSALDAADEADDQPMGGPNQGPVE